MSQDRILAVSGSRDWADPDPIYQLIACFDPGWTLVIHGAARGADRIAGVIAKRLGFYVIPFPANWARYGLGAGPERNEVMWRFCLQNQAYGVQIHAGLFPLPQSKGTLHMHGLCLRSGFNIHVPEACKSYL